MSVVINVFLLRSLVKRFDQPIDRKTNAVQVFRGAANLEFDCRFFLQVPQQHPPTWISFVNSGLGSPLPNLYLSGASGVLVIKASNRFFAITFGRGRYLLMPGSYEEDFGLKVALNRVDGDDLKSIDTKVYDEMVTSSRIQVSHDSSIEDFGVNLSRDILRAVQGRAKDQTFANRLAGSDAITLSRSDLDFHELGSLCSDLLIAYGEKTYQSRFKWVDNVRLVRDAVVLKNLDAELVAALKSRRLGNMHLALSEIENTINISAYRFTGMARAGEFLNLELSGYLRDAVGKRLAVLTAEMLRKHMIKVRVAGSADFELRSSVYQSLVWETTLKGKTYALFDGRWFEVDSSYAQEVTNYCNGLIKMAYPLPSAGLNETEGDYNKRIAASDPSLALFDCQPLKPTGASSSIEFCDLMSDRGHLIHVKWRYSSATFSHLFSQGSVSAETFIRDQGFRQEVSQKLSTHGKSKHLSLVPAIRPAPTNYEVVFAVIAPSSAASHLLPFFSAVNLKNHGQRLETIGVRVALQHIIAQ